MRTQTENRAPSSRRGWRAAWLAAAWSLGMAVTIQAQTPSLDGEPAGFATLSVTNGPTPSEVRLHVGLKLERSKYYSLQQSADLVTFEPIRMTLGTGIDAVNAWDVSVPAGPTSQRFWRVQAVSIYESADGDGDGLDDVFELRQPGHVLDPSNPSDAAMIAPGGTITWLERYRTVFGRGLGGIEAISREVTVFNLELAPARLEAISREVSVFNLELAPVGIEAISREVSVFNLELAPAALEAISREVSVLNQINP